MDGSLSLYGFRMENMLLTGYSLYNKKDEYRAKMNVECLEACEMILIPLEAFKYIEEILR